MALHHFVAAKPQQKSTAKLRRCLPWENSDIALSERCAIIAVKHTVL
nr:MAG TPA: hypothetical protein [Caudoviricetes sp.]